MQTGGRETGTPDVTFDLSSVLYHALRAVQALDRYAADARYSGDGEVAHFMERARDANRSMCDDAKQLLHARLALRTQEKIADEASEESFPASDPPAV
jgi:hypothetical protein